MRSVIATLLQELRPGFDLGERFPSLAQSMRNRDMDLQSPHMRFGSKVEARSEHTVGESGTQSLDMRYWEYPATQQRAQIMQKILDYYCSSFMSHQWRDYEKKAKLVPEIHAELEGLGDGVEGSLLDRLEQLGLVDDVSSEWSSYETLAAETKKMIREQQANEAKEMEGLKVLWSGLACYFHSPLSDTPTVSRLHYVYRYDSIAAGSFFGNEPLSYERGFLLVSWC